MPVRESPPARGARGHVGLWQDPTRPADAPRGGANRAALVFAGDESAAEVALINELAAGVDSSGIVYLVGAGPGAPDLLTLRAPRLLGEADVIVHDRLVSDEVPDMARRDAERIFVGKSRANHCMKQDDINALLVRLARAGKHVVRLKGGDPLVSGRDGEEAEALAAAGVAFEIVPGVTAALACAADAGVALTHRDASRAVTLATGHTKDGRLDLDFAALARPGATLAIYMGVRTLGLLLEGLARHGLDPTTPAALVERHTPAARPGRLFAGIGGAGAWPSTRCTSAVRPVRPDTVCIGS